MAQARVEFSQLYVSMVIILMTFHVAYGDNQTLFTFIEGPQTDQECYLVGENGTMNVLFGVGRGSFPLNQYQIALNTDSKGRGFWKTRGNYILFYEGSQSGENGRFVATQDYDEGNRTLTYNLKVTSLTLLDLTLPLYALIIDKYSGNIMKVSTETFNFNVETECLRDDGPKPTPNQSTPQLASKWSFLGAVVAIMLFMIH